MKRQNKQKCSFIYVIVLFVTIFVFFYWYYRKSINEYKNQLEEATSKYYNLSEKEQTLTNSMAKLRQENSALKQLSLKSKNQLLRLKKKLKRLTSKNKALLYTKTENKKKNNDEKRVVSFGLYGNKPIYLIGALRNVELIHALLPNWIPRFYHDNTVPSETLNQLKEMGAELFNQSISTSETIDDSNGNNTLIKVDRYIVRDVDSRISVREVKAIEEWIESDFPIHSMRDHPNHNYPFNGGMWGAIKGAIIPDNNKGNGRKNSMKEKIIQWEYKDEYIGDMDFLRFMIYPTLKRKGNMILSHDSYNCENWVNSRPFPTRRIMKEHVGQVFDEYERPRMSDIVPFLEKPVPEKCRKNKNWIFG
ncbi:hypothetical protein ABK040_007937 [Willaertia magna]